MHYCTLRAELLMALHELIVGDICSVDPARGRPAPSPGRQALAPSGDAGGAPPRDAVARPHGGRVRPPTPPTALQRPHRLQGLSVTASGQPHRLLLLGSALLLQSPRVVSLCVLEQGFSHCPVLT